ncbi:hypothetical protein [Scytonema sp. NUACC21]
MKLEDFLQDAYTPPPGLKTKILSLRLVQAFKNSLLGLAMSLFFFSKAVSLLFYNP